MTTVTYTGNITDKDGPQLRFTQAGKAVASFNMAVNSRSKRDGEWVDDPPLFIRVNAWDDLGENAAESLRKGDRVTVVGRQKMTEYTSREGETRQQLEVTADEVAVSLRWATATPAKVDRRQGGGRTPQPSPQGEQWNGGGYSDAPQGGGFDQDQVPF